MPWMSLKATSALLLTAITLLGSFDSAQSLTAQDVQLNVAAGKALNDSLLWGTYRPNLYFGTKPRIPSSLSTGIMWFSGDDLQGFQNIRHTCEQGDNLHGYGYFKHDGRSFAFQKMKDPYTDIELTTEFIKVPGGRYGGEWGVRIKGKPLTEGANPVTNLVFYVGLEGDGGIDIVSKLKSDGLKSPVKMEGDSPELGDFAIQFAEGAANTAPRSGLQKDLTKTFYWGFQAPEDEIWKTKDFFLQKVYDSARERSSMMTPEEAMSNLPSLFVLPNQISESENEVANLYFLQKVFQGAFEVDIVFNSDSSAEHLKPQDMNAKLETATTKFDQKFENTFHLSEKGFKSPEEIEFGQFLLSNLLGGIGYFYGPAIVDRSHDPFEDEEYFANRPPNAQLTEPHALYSATPSRPFFPRGFYWDEGFHQQVIGKWDNDLSLEIIKSWVSLIDDNGWVAREQILGAEARSKVPQEFQTQFPHYANPPTLLLAVQKFIDRLEQHTSAHMQMSDEPVQNRMKVSALDDPELLPNLHLENPALATQWLTTVYPKLRLNWEWFRKTQKGHKPSNGNGEVYRWRGRTENHTLTSGFDDYPRAEPPSTSELHIDLISWMGFSTRLMKSIAGHLGEEYAADVQEYDSVLQDILGNIDALHWSENDQAYCDLLLQGGDSVDYVCHKGYLSLFPMILGLLPTDSPKLDAILDMMRDENELWTPYGLRSLSVSDAKFNTGENYWRGPIWMNVNYLALQSLHNNYMHVPGPYQEKAQQIYKDLRNNIIQNVFAEYKRTGFVWEQYSAFDGQGKRSHPFTGWTSTVLLMMAEEY
ncbi:glycoside hydrolase [Umbelopsis sp. AD052]|nr:glycoside hydrolase [Umbelopsis sp. AD052]